MREITEIEEIVFNAMSDGATVEEVHGLVRYSLRQGTCGYHKSFRCLAEMFDRPIPKYEGYSQMLRIESETLFQVETEAIS